MSATKLYPTKCTFRRCIDNVDSARRSSARRRQTMVPWWGKTSYFVAKCVNISKIVGDTSKVTIYNYNKKLNMRFRLTPRSMTLDDPELYKFEFSGNFLGFISQISDATTAKRMKIDQYCQYCKHVELEQFLACFLVARV